MFLIAVYQVEVKKNFKDCIFFFEFEIVIPTSHYYDL